MKNILRGTVQPYRVVLVILWIGLMAAVSLATPVRSWLTGDATAAAINPVATEPAATEAAEEDSGAGLASRGVVLALVLGLLAGAGIGWGAGRVTARRAHTPIAEPSKPDLLWRKAPDPPDPRIVEHLVEGLVASHDLATNDAQRARIRDALRRAGVAPLAPALLEPFDPEHHKALAVEPNADAAKAGRIARVERVGWTRGDEVLRPPEVTVYPKLGPPPSG